MRSPNTFNRAVWSSRHKLHYSPYPRECDELMEALTRDYEFVSEDYPVAWKFRQYLKNLQLCDFSEILDDVYYENDRLGEPIVKCKRVIFFSCRPKDVERISYILERIGNGIATIYDEEGEIIYGGLWDVW